MMSPGPEHDWPEAKRPSVRKSGAVSNIVETSDHCFSSGVHIGVLDKYFLYQLQCRVNGPKEDPDYRPHFLASNGHIFPRSTPHQW